jgi:hypothetical protein
MEPLEEITLWHGIIIGKGLEEFAVPTALDAFIFPLILATSL